MANKSAEKQARVASRRQQRNKAIRSEIKTTVSKAEKLILTGDVKSAETAVAEAVKTLDKAAEKKILHANNAARRKSRLVKKLNVAAGQAKAEPAPDAG